MGISSGRIPCGLCEVAEMRMSNWQAAERGLEGLKVLALESRHAAQMAQLIENQGGIAIRAPAMREVPLEDNTTALAFAEELFAGQFDAVIFLTGVGTRILFGSVETKHPRTRLVEALSRVAVISRGPKPATALRGFGVPIAVAVPEPNTWRELLKALDEYPPLTPLRGKRMAIQEYGVSNREFLEGLETRGVLLRTVPVYRWALPEDVGPLRQAIEQIVQGGVDVVFVTSANQVHNLMQVAAQQNLGEALRQGLQHALVASVGPITTEALRDYGIFADFEPSHPKMGPLVLETSQKAEGLLRQKRALR